MRAAAWIVPTFFLVLASACSETVIEDGGLEKRDGSAAEAGPLDASAADLGPIEDSGGPQDAGFDPDAGFADAIVFDDAAEPEDAAEPQDAAELDAGKPDAGSACDPSPCFAGVACSDVPGMPGSFTCGSCPAGYVGDGITCGELDACAVAPCLPGTTCTDLPAPDTGYTCSPCTGPTCPIFRALAGPDQVVVSGDLVLLQGSATGANGAFSCSWSDDRGGPTLGACTATVTVAQQTVFTLTVTDASGAIASDDLVVRIVPLGVDAGPDSNVLGGEVATLTGSWSGASCADASCIACEWQRPDGSVLAQTCTATASPAVTTQYILTVTDTNTGSQGTDSTTVFVTDLPANLCGWNVVVMTSDEYPTAPNPNYVCSPSGAARRQTINGKPSLVLSDLVVQNARIVGYIGVETSGDDDLIGIAWGLENPAHMYLLTWKQLNQSWTARCGNSLAGIAVKKVDGSTTAPSGIAFNPSFGFNATQYVYSCAISWSTDRNNASILGDDSIFLVSPRDPGAFTGGWRDFITYRFEIYHTPARTKVRVYEDDLRNGSTAVLVEELSIVDSSYPRGQVAFFSNSQEQVDFSDFTFASLAGFTADAGPDQTVSAGQIATLSGGAELAVPPFGCAWSAGGTPVAATCTATVGPQQDTTYTLTVTDDFGRVAVDQVRVAVQ